jgi:WD40 repeat protein
MKLNLFLAVLCISLVSQITDINAAIYVSELVDGNRDSRRTLVSVFEGNGARREEFYVNSTLARMAPDKKHWAYVEQGTEASGAWELALADARGKKVQTMNGLDAKFKKGTEVIAMDWSPDATKLAILIANSGVTLKPSGRLVSLIVYDRIQQKTHPVTEFYQTEGLDLLVLAGILRWLPDNSRILFSTYEETTVFDTRSSTAETVYKGPAIARLIGDKKRILLFARDKEKERQPFMLLQGNNFDILEYDIQQKATKKITSAQLTPWSCAVSHDGTQLLILLGEPPQLSSLNLATGKREKLDMPTPIIPRAFSPTNNKLVAGFGAHGEYLIYDLQTSKYHKLKDPDRQELRGEAALGHFLTGGIEWVE